MSDGWEGARAIEEMVKIEGDSPFVLFGFSFNPRRVIQTASNPFLGISGGWGFALLGHRERGRGGQDGRIREDEKRVVGVRYGWRYRVRDGFNNIPWHLKLDLPNYPSPSSPANPSQSSQRAATEP